MALFVAETLACAGMVLSLLPILLHLVPILYFLGGFENVKGTTIKSMILITKVKAGVD